MDGFFSWLNSLWGGLSGVLIAVLLLVLAFIVAAIVKALFVKLVAKTKLGDFLAKADKDRPGQTLNLLGKLVYLIVFLLFVPGIFSALNAGSIAEPILSMLNTIWGYIPNILGAVIVLIVGFLIAKLVRQLLIPLFERIGVDKLQEKMGISPQSNFRLSHTLAFIVYVIIIIPVIIIALQVLKITAISDPAIGMLHTIFGFIPNIIVAILIIVVGVFIGRFVNQLLTRVLGATGVDEKLKGIVGDKMGTFSLTKIVAITAQVLIIIFFTVQGLNILQLSVLTNVGTAIIAYLPRVLAAVIILVAAVIVAGLAEKGLKKAGFSVYSRIAKALIMIIATVMILTQLGIAEKVVMTAFIIIIGAVGVAFAIAFGVGGRQFAAEVLAEMKAKHEAAKAAAEAEKAAEEKAVEEKTDEKSVEEAADVLDKQNFAESAADKLANKLTEKLD